MIAPSRGQPSWPLSCQIDVLRSAYAPVPKAATTALDSPLNARHAVIKLPDGYVIDVASCSWQRIAQLTGYENRLRSARGPRRRGVQQDILDAYNVGAP
jgi:hypothetical protein